MATRGPVPKRTSQRRRTNAPEIPTTTSPGAAEVEWPEPDTGWHAIATRWYQGLQRSGMAAYCEPSDVAEAYMWAEAIHRAYTSPRLSGQLMAVIRAAGGALGVTEGDRRRLRIELQRGEPQEPTSQAALRKYRLVIGGSSEGGS